MSFEGHRDYLIKECYVRLVNLRILQEISASFEELNTSAIQVIQEHLLRTLVKLLQETVPQFILENNTQVC